MHKVVRPGPIRRAPVAIPAEAVDDDRPSSADGGTLRHMSEGITRLLEAQGGVASARELLVAGFSRRTVERMVRRGELVRVRRDALVLASVLTGATPWEKRALAARAVGRSLAQSPGAATHALSHESALMVHGLPWFGEDGLVHLVRTDGRRGRRDDTVWVHRPVDARWVGVVDGLRVVSPGLAALQVAATHGVEAGLVAVDGVLHQAGTADLADHTRWDAAAAARMRHEVARALGTVRGAGASAAALVLEHADGRSESAGESRSRWLVHSLGLGPCTPQFEVRDGPLLVGIADLKLDRWPVLVEFDGAGKYTSHESLLAEKDREDRMRTLGYELVRIRWNDLARPQVVRRRLLEAVARAESRATAAG